MRSLIFLVVVQTYFYFRHLMASFLFCKAGLPATFNAKIKPETAALLFSMIWMAIVYHPKGFILTAFKMEMSAVRSRWYLRVNGHLERYYPAAHLRQFPGRRSARTCS
jgi:hypothetical protein